MVGIGTRQHAGYALDAFLNGSRGAALVLHDHLVQHIGLVRTDRGNDGANLVLLTAQAHQQHTGKVGMGGVAHHGATQNIHAVARRTHAATQGMRQSHDAVHMRIVAQAFLAKVPRNGAHHGRRAINRCNHTNIVARTDLAIGASITHELGRPGHRHGWLHALANGVVAGELAHGQIVGVHMLTGGNLALGKTNDLVVATHRRASRNSVRCKLVARRNQVGGAYAITIHHSAGQ